MADETVSVWADIWARARALAVGWPKTSWTIAGFVAGIATRLVF